MHTFSSQARAECTVTICHVMAHISLLPTTSTTIFYYDAIHYSPPYNKGNECEKMRCRVNIETEEKKRKFNPICSSTKKNQHQQEKNTYIFSIIHNNIVWIAVYLSDFSHFIYTLTTYIFHST